MTAGLKPKPTGPTGPARRVAVIGVGNMGAAMAANLLSRGWQVQVCDVGLELSRRLSLAR